MANDAQTGATLLTIARAAIAEALGRHHPADDSAPWLQQPGATFVTLMRAGQLRGCIGSLQAERSLLADVRSNAVGAALRDPRFDPLKADELDEVCIGVSLLSAMDTIAFDTETDALAQLRPGIDGLVLQYGAQRSTFLPQVWEQLPEPSQFVAELKAKAGLAPGFWSDGIVLQRYTVAKWEEDERAAAAAMEVSR